MRTSRHVLLEAAGDTSNGAGTGSSTVLTGDNGGGGTQSTQGQQNTGDKAASEKSATSTSDKSGSAQGSSVGDWRSQLPAELRDDPALKVVHDVPSLAKSYVHAQKLVGKDKIVVPDKHATEDDWKQVYEKLGLPKEVKDYTVNVAKESKLDPKFVEGFKEISLKAGVLPQQAQKVVDWFVEINKGAEAEVKAQHEANVKKNLEGLKAEWGAAYEQNLAKASRVVKEMNDPELINYLEETGLGNDVKLIKLFSKISEKYMSEDKAIGGNNNITPKYSPKEALLQANKIIANLDHPYHKHDHPNHRAAVDEVKELFEMSSFKG